MTGVRTAPLAAREHIENIDRRHSFQLSRVEAVKEVVLSPNDCRGRVSQPTAMVLIKSGPLKETVVAAAKGPGTQSCGLKIYTFAMNQTSQRL